MELGVSGETSLDEARMEQEIWAILCPLDFRRFSGTVLMERLYEVLNEFIGDGLRCLKCGDWMWAYYAEGRMWKRCLSCYWAPFGQLYYVSLITDPVGPMPRMFESRPKENWTPYAWEFEKFYYRKRNQGKYRKDILNWRREGF